MKKLLECQAKALALTTILLLSIANTLSAQKVAIIDAGSSGSRLYVYEIEKSSGDFTILYPSPEQEANSKGRALSSIANHSDSVRVFLSTMTSKYNRKDTVEQIPLYILATAGMRMLPKAKVDSIYEKINSQTAELNGFRLDTAMTISGRYEGFYAYIAANYKNGKLKFNTSVPENSFTSAPAPYGILEIGGASMQIAFAVDEQCENCISRGGVHIYSKSYLGGGVDQIYKKNKDKTTPDFSVSLDGVGDLYGEQPQFLGLGKPIGVLLDAAKVNSVSALTSYANSLPRNDSEKNYHPWINARYITWVIESLNLDEKLVTLKTKSDWTEGAALDILVNQEKPEGFDYEKVN